MKFLINIFNKCFNIFFTPVENNIRKHLYNKNISSDIIDFIIYKSIKYNNLFELYTYLNNPTITYDDLNTNSDLITLFSPTNLNKNLIQDIINISGTSGTVTFGKGEIALIIFIVDAFKYNKKGDIIINDLVYEIKHNKSQISESKYVRRTTKLDMFSEYKFQLFIDRYKPDLSQKSTWIKLIFDINPSIEDFTNLLENLYPGLNIEYDFSSVNALNNSIGLALSKNYLSEKILLIIDKNNKYICVKDYDEFKSLLDTKIKFNLASDLIPRCELIF